MTEKQPSDATEAERPLQVVQRGSDAKLRVTRRDHEGSGAAFAQTLDAAARMPGVRINRAAYLRAALRRHCTQEQIDRAVEESPAAAGVSISIVNRLADQAISHETRKVTAISAVAGLPGGVAMVGTVPADAAQYFGHMLRIAQKLAYLYSWPELFVNEDEEMDDATEGIFTLFVGVMLGLQAAQTGVTTVSAMISKEVARRLPQKALTKGAVYPVVKKVASYVGVRMTKQMFARGVSKFVPVVGAALSGGLTYVTFRPMSKKLQAHLAKLELAKPVPWADAGHTVSAVAD